MGLFMIMRSPSFSGYGSLTLCRKKNWLFTLINEVLRNGHVQIGGEHEFNFRSGMVGSDICQGDPSGLIMTPSWIMANNAQYWLMIVSKCV